LKKTEKLDELVGVMAGDMLNGRTVHSLIRGLSKYKKNTIYLLSPKELKLTKEDFSKFSKEGIKLIEIESGAQIIQKVTTNYSLLKPKLKKITEQLKKDGFKTVNYNNTELETDLLRIQSTKGIMKAHNKFNENGEKIIESLTL
jgi:aspartate carbamoyltransferase catalytic subunit